MGIVSFHPLIKGKVNSSVAGKSVLTSRQLRLIKNADAVILPEICPKFLYYAVQEFQKPCFPDQRIRYECQDKLSQIRFFEVNRIPHPKTLIFPDLHSLMESTGKNSWELGFPFVIKLPWSHEGDGIFVIEDKDAFTIQLPQIQKKISKDEAVIAQKFVPTKGYVLRVVVFYDKLVPYWKVGKGPIISISKGAKVMRDLFPELKEKGMDSVKEVKSKIRVDLAALDMIFDMERPTLPLWLELNFSFGRRGLGGRRGFYDLLLRAVKTWLQDLALDPQVTLLA